MLRWYGSSWEQDRKAMLPHLEAMLVHLGAMLAHLGAMLAPRLADLEAYVDPCWAKRSEKWEQQKNTVKRMIFCWSAAYLGAMLAHLGAMLAYLEGNVGPSWGHVGPSWGLCWPILGLWCPILGLCWPILGLCWPILGPMLAHLGAYVGPWPILSHKSRKRAKKWEEHKTPGRAQNTVGDTRLVGGRGGGPSLLRRGEKRRTAMPRPGGPWLDYIIEWANARVPPTPLWSPNKTVWLGLKASKRWSGSPNKTVCRGFNGLNKGLKAGKRHSWTPNDRMCSAGADSNASEGRQTAERLNNRVCKAAVEGGRVWRLATGSLE